jgi:hypothetical protein
MDVSITEVIEKARTELHKLAGLEISSTVGVVREDDWWLVTFEVIEKHSIPDSMDILATYETKMDFDANMLEFKRTSMRKRIETGEAEE